MSVYSESAYGAIDEWLEFLSDHYHAIPPWCHNPSRRFVKRIENNRRRQCRLPLFSVITSYTFFCLLENENQRFSYMALP